MPESDNQTLDCPSQESRRDGDAEASVEKALIAICRDVLRTDRIDPRRSFFELGGDSLSLVHYLSAILRQFAVGLTTEALLETRSINEVKRLIVDKLSGTDPQGGTGAGDVCGAARVPLRVQPVLPRQEPIVGPVDLIANRYSYFLRRKRNLEFWNVSTEVLDMRERVDVVALKSATEQLVTHHDGLRLQVFADAGWKQVILGPDEVHPLVSMTFSGAASGSEFKRLVETHISELQNGFSFPGELFKILHVRNESKDVLFVIAHHLIVDGFSFGLLLGDLFHLYRRYARGKATFLPAKTTSFQDYCKTSTEYWMLHETEELRYWESLPWDRVKPVPVDYALPECANLEGYTQCVVRSVPVQDDRGLGTALPDETRYTFVDNLLCAISRAYHEWTGHDLLLLALVFHGRESFLEGVDLARTVGWISETVPVLLQPSVPLEEHLKDTHRQAQRAARRGKSYGVLRFLTGNGAVAARLRGHPEPQVSLNISMPAFHHTDFSDLAEPSSQYSLGVGNKHDTERVFLLSGGVYFHARQFHLSWDFSTKVFKESTIGRFTDQCIAELTRLTCGRLESLAGSIDARELIKPQATVLDHPADLQ